MLILEYFSLKNIGKQENKKKGYFKKFKLLNHNKVGHQDLINKNFK
jgi:hypothetical protein